ncbi:hypothetical protein D3C84_1243540 [compost metagenome]
MSERPCEVQQHRDALQCIRCLGIRAEHAIRNVQLRGERLQFFGIAPRDDNVQPLPLGMLDRHATGVPRRPVNH